MAPPDDARTIPRPTLLRNLGFWLLAMLLGTLLVLLGLPVLDVNNPDSFLPFMLLMTVAVASLLSLAALPLLLPLLPWAMGAHTVGQRWLRVFTLQSASLGSLMALVFYGGGSALGAMGAPLAGTYFVSGLLAAWLVYRPWLGRQPRPAVAAQNRLVR